MSTINANFTDGELTITDDGGNSATLLLSEGDFSLTYDAQDGRQVTISETRGSVTAVRKAARQISTISMTAKLAEPNDDFQLIAEGQIAGYVSTVADLGDANGADWDFTFDYGAEVRKYFGDDAVFGNITITEGDPSTIAFEAQVIGPIYAKDANGTTTLVSSR